MYIILTLSSAPGIVFPGRIFGSVAYGEKQWIDVRIAGRKPYYSWHSPSVPSSHLRIWHGHSLTSQTLHESNPRSRHNSSMPAWCPCQGCEPKEFAIGCPKVLQALDSPFTVHLQSIHERQNKSLWVSTLLRSIKYRMTYYIVILDNVFDPPKLFPLVQLPTHGSMLRALIVHCILSGLPKCTHGIAFCCDFPKLQRLVWR